MGPEAKVFAFIMIFINLAGFIVVAVDKLKARRKAWRIPERTLFWFALIGGSVGVYAGLLTFRHKTRKWYFMWGIPFIFLIQIAIAIYLMR